MHTIADADTILKDLTSDDPVTRARGRFLATGILDQLRDFISSEIGRDQMDPTTGIDALNAVSISLIWLMGAMASVLTDPDKSEEVVASFLQGAESNFRLGLSARSNPN